MVEEEAAGELVEAADGETATGQLDSQVGQEEDMVFQAFQQGSQTKKRWISSETKLRSSGSN